MTLESWLKSAPFTLSLSAGFFGFYSHLGVAKALAYKNILPAKWTGCSAGAIIAAAGASGVDWSALEQRLLSLKRHDFWDPAFGVGLLAGNKFESLLCEFLPFQFDEVKTPLEISVFDMKKLRHLRLDKGHLPKAVRASGTVPLMFHPTRIQKRFYLDGGITHKTAINYSDSRVFSHFLHSGSRWDQFELIRHKFSIRKMSCQTLIIKNLKNLGPFKLNAGHDVIKQSFDRTLTALELNIENQNLCVV